MLIVDIQYLFTIQEGIDVNYIILMDDYFFFVFI